MLNKEGIGENRNKFDGKLKKGRSRKNIKQN